MKITSNKKVRIYMHWGFGFWPLLPLFWIGIVALFCWGALRWFGWRDRRGGFFPPGGVAFLTGGVGNPGPRHWRGGVAWGCFCSVRGGVGRFWGGPGLFR